MEIRKNDMTHLIRKLAASTAAIVLAFSTVAYAQQHVPTPVPTTDVAASSVEMGGPALWKVADDDTTIYLFGTIHALPKEVDWYKGNVAQALVSSDILVTEVIASPDMANEMQQIIMSKGILPPGETLRGLLDDKQKASYEGAMTKLGLPIAAFDQFEPWYASLMMSMLPLLKEGYSPDSGVEMVLTEKGGKEKPRGQLETIEFQMSVFDQLPIKSQIDFLIQASDQVDQIKPMLDAMVAEWLKGDADGLAKLMNEGLTDQMLADRLLYSRNRTWAEWIKTRLDTPGTVFIAVGAGHLAGTNSVQDALAERGISAARVQ